MTPGAFRFFLAALVVIHHSFPLRLGSWAVGMFFVLSGYWISRMWRLKYKERINPYSGFLISRWWRLAPVFLVCQLLTIGLIEAGITAGNPSAPQQLGWWVTQPAILGNAQVTRLLPPAWSLDVEMQFYAIAPLLVGGIVGMSRGSMAGLIAGTFGWSVLRLATTAELETPLIDVYLWLFTVGVCADLIGWQPRTRIASSSLLLTSGLIVALLATPSTRSLLWRRGGEAVTTSGSFGGEGLFLVLSLLAIPFAISTVHRPSGAWDRWLGDLSYPLYLFHWLPRDWYYANVDWAMPSWRNGVLLLANCVFACVGAIVLLHVVDRPAQKVRARWLERRQMRDNGSPTELT